MDRSASSRMSLLDPRTSSEIVWPGFCIPVTCITYQHTCTDYTATHLYRQTQRVRQRETVRLPDRF